MSASNFPNYIKLFGNIDFRKADEARSVYSPAAYLADLLQLIDDHLEQPDRGTEEAPNPDFRTRFDQRRTDIVNTVLLDGENTNTLLPYLDIVNKVLETKIVNEASTQNSKATVQPDNGERDAYDILAQADYPFNLPFDLNHERVALYEKYLGITPEAIHKAFTKSYNPDVVAREFLGLSSRDVEIVTQPATDLEQRYGDLLPGIGSTLQQIVVNDFVEVTDITHADLRELLKGHLNDDEWNAEKQSEFFTNFGLGSFASYDATEEHVVWSSGSEEAIIPDAWCDRAQRLIRLSRLTSIAIADLDLILRSCCNHTLDTESLKRIAIIQTLATAFDLPIDETCALFSPINRLGYGDADLPQDLFNRVFNNRFMRLDHTHVGELMEWSKAPKNLRRLTYFGDILALENQDYRNRIAQSLKISEAQLQVIIRGFRSRDNNEIDNEDERDRLWGNPTEEMDMLSACYRVTKLVEVLDTSIEDLFILLDCVERDPAVRKFANSGVLIDYSGLGAPATSIAERDAYKILQQAPSEEIIRQRFWLIQLLHSLSRWLMEQGLTAEEFLKITTGRHRRYLQAPSVLNKQQAAAIAAAAKTEKIMLLNSLYTQVKPWLLNDASFISNTFDSRFARLIYGQIAQSDLVSKFDPRLVRFHKDALDKVAYAAIDHIDVITQADFLDLGLEAKIAHKIFANLVFRGYLTTEGRLDAIKLPATAAEFALKSDFTDLKPALFEVIASLHENHVDVAIYPSDLEELGLSKMELDELYDNLIFNGFLSPDGSLLQSSTFTSSDHLDLFEIGSEIGDYADTVYALLKAADDKFQQTKIVVTPAVFEDLPLSESELADLIENLKFNEYLGAENILTSNTALLQVRPEDFLLELRFYPHWRLILKALQTHIERHQQQCYTFQPEQFFEVAEQLAADWAFEAISAAYLEEGRIAPQYETLFADPENAAALDVAWSFELSHNRLVFERLREIVQMTNQYRLTNDLFEAFKFDETEIDDVVTVLVTSGYLTETRKLPADKLPYFLNINNALEFIVPAFEDYNKDIFFALHEIAKRMEQTKQEIATIHQGLVTGQESALYQSLQDVFGLPAESIAAISRQVYAGNLDVHEAWLVPILPTVNLHDEIDREPDSSRFNTAYQRIQQFALLAAKLKLDRPEIEIAFRDQNLVEKYPENIELPDIIIDGVASPITSFDALLESRDGHIYLFKSAPDPGNGYARYWAYSAITHELIETEDDKLSTLLTGDPDSTISLRRVDAAFIDQQGHEVIIADGRYYVKVKAKDGWVWQIRDREWGRVENDFDHLRAIDAAFTDEAGYTYLFANDQYLRYSGDFTIDNAFVDDGYPKNIGESWPDEGRNQTLPEDFYWSLDAAFHGTNNKTYFFKDGQFVCSSEPEVRQSTAEVWGRVRNHLKASRQVDAVYSDGAQYFVLSGDQVFAYHDCLENQDVMLQEGYPQFLIDHVGSSLPGEFHAGVDAAFRGEDGNLHLFKGDKTVAIATPLGSESPMARSINLKALWNTFESTLSTRGLATALAGLEDRILWGFFENPLGTVGQVDATLVGLDGRVYLFSGDSYYRYSYSDYSAVDTGYPRRIRDDWGGLDTIRAAFVLDGKTYLFGAIQRDGASSSDNVYVRYSTNDYEQPDDDYPKSQTESDDDWWNLPEAIKTTGNFQSVDAVFNAPDGKTFLFAGRFYIYFDHIQGWWSEPYPLSELWENMPFTSIDDAFYGKDGKTYVFGHSGDTHEYMRFSGSDYRHPDNGYPRPTNRLWGHVKNNIAERGIVDAALVVESREAEEQDNGTVETVKTLHTYLFSGDQFFRYQGGDYRRVEPGYPKTLRSLKDEPRFKHLGVTLDEGIDAAFSDRRNIYLIKNSTIHVTSEALCARYEGQHTPALTAITCAFIDQGAIYVEKTEETDDRAWYHLSSVEGRDTRLANEPVVALTPLPSPPLFVDEDILPAYRTNLDAVLLGADGNTYLFQDTTFFDVELKRAFPIAEKWGRVRNNIQDRNEIDAGFVGRDGRTYLFSGDQYMVYEEHTEGRPYIRQPVFVESADGPAVHSIAAHWGGLTSVHLAYVMQNRTYLFEEPDENGTFRYVCYSSTDYDRPDPGYPKTADTDFWQIPDSYLDQGWDSFAAIVIGNDDTMLFLKGQEFLQFNARTSHWSQPQPLDYLWDGTHQDDDLFENLQSAFVGADGTGYFFGDNCYVIYSDSKFSARELIGDDWGILPSQFSQKVDAACVHPNGTTYLFAGDRYIRYSSTDYRHIDDGYPKSILQDLRQETGFENLPPEFEVRAGELNRGEAPVILNAVVVNSRHTYLFMGGDCYIASSAITATYDTQMLGDQRNHLAETGDVNAAVVIDGKTYLFSGDQYVRYSESNYDEVDAGYPKRLTTGLLADLQRDIANAPESASAISLPTVFQSNIDAALYQRGTVYLFKGEHFFTFSPQSNDRSDEAEMVTAIVEHWGRLHNNFIALGENAAIDGAFVDPMGRLYVFKGDQFIRYADTEQEYVETGYPKLIHSTFRLPASFATPSQNERSAKFGVTGAFTFEGRTYLVKGEEYVRYLDDDYGCLPSFYPIKFTDAWGDWSDYRLEDLQLISRFKSLQERYRGDHALVDILRADQGLVKHPYAMLADIFGWNVEEVRWLKRHHAFLPTATKYEPQSETQFNLELIARMVDIFAVTTKLGTSVKQAYEDIWQPMCRANSYLVLLVFWWKWYRKIQANQPLKTEALDLWFISLYHLVSAPKLKLAADTLLTLLSHKNGNSPDLDVLVDEVHNKLNELKRDALVPYAIFTDPTETVDDTRDLYEQLLIDIQMGASAQTSRVEEAIAAVQLYFHRYFIDLEPLALRATPPRIQKETLKERWQWMRNYRVWEANRKVFLYPENYIRPELRDTKTPEFKSLEEDLLKGDLTEANITQSLNRYIDRYIEVSRLTIAGGYVYDSQTDAEDKHLILFGHTKTQPHQYFYRKATFVDGRSDAVDWQPWLEVNVQIDADRVYPVYALNKIFVFWAKVEVRSSVRPDTQFKLRQESDSRIRPETDVVNESVLQVYYSYYNLNGEWTNPQKIQYEITSNDTITNISLNFSGDKPEDGQRNLDNIVVSCHYTTERPIKLEVNSDNRVDAEELRQRLHGKQVYLKASNAQESYFLDDHPTTDLAFAKLLLPGDVLDASTKFQIRSVADLFPAAFQATVAAQWTWASAIALASPTEPNHYLQWLDDGSVRMAALPGIAVLSVQKGNVSFSPQFLDFIIRSSFWVTKGAIGEGYSFRPATAPDRILLYQEDSNYQMLVKVQDWRTIQTHSEKRQTTFSFISDRTEETNTFRFYPETNVAKEVKGIPIPPQSGINTFKRLFPQEQVQLVGRPVLLNEPQDQNSASWICFDYKGGSFLCKPASGQTSNLDAKADITLPSEFTGPISAAVYAWGNTVFFSGNDQYVIEGETAVHSVKDTWGRVNNTIQYQGKIDAAFVRTVNDQVVTFLFCDDQYVAYRNGYGFVDESYPKRLSTNTDNLPPWGRMDTAFQIGEISYFIKENQYVTSEALTTERPVFGGLLNADTPVTKLRNVFIHRGTIYTIDYSGKLSRETSENALKRKLDAQYLSRSEVNFAHVVSAFFFDKAAYLQIDDPNSTDPVEYVKYVQPGRSRRFRFGPLSGSQTDEAIFVVGNYFYILANPGRNQSPVIWRWDKNTSPAAAVRIEISGAPSRKVQTFFYDGTHTYLFSGNGEDTEYMQLTGLPNFAGDAPTPLAWVRQGTVSDLLASMEGWHQITRIHAGFTHQTGKLFLVSGNQYLRFSLLESSATAGPVLPTPDEGYPKFLRNAAPEDNLPAWDGIDAAFQGVDGLVRCFAGQSYSTYNPATEAWSPLSPIRDDWGKVKNNLQETGKVDAAVSLGSYVYLFAGDQYYRYPVRRLDPPVLEEGYPKRLATNEEGLPTFPGEIAFAFSFGGKGYLYYRGGQLYAEFDPNRKQFLTARPPVNWPGTLDGREFDAAYTKDGHLYLIAGRTYLKFLNPTEELIRTGHLKYDIIRLSSMTGSQLSQILFVEGIDGLMQRSTQEINESPRFTLNADETGDTIIRANSANVSATNFPINSQLEFRGANGLYYWELFYHAPALIAQALNAAQKFAEAKQWYEYIFDPTQANRYWNFLPFLAEDIDALITGLEPWKTFNETAAESGTTRTINRAATQVIEKLKPFAAAFIGLRPLSADEKAELDRLRDLPEQPPIPATSLRHALDELATALNTLQQQTPRVGEATRQKIRATQEEIEIIRRLPSRYDDLVRNGGPEQIKRYLDDPFDPHAIAALRLAAYRRTTVMAYIDNLLDWGDMLFRQYTRESITEARMLYVLAYDLLGKKPESLGTKVLSAALPYSDLQDATAGAYDFLFDAPQAAIVNRGLTHAALVHESVGNPYFYIPENEQLLGYWERVEDRLYKIRHSLNIMGIEQPLPLFQPPIDPMAIVRAMAGGGGISVALEGLQVTVPHYRFTFMLNKARELVGKLNQFGSDLLGTLEKKDAEELSLLQNRQEGVILQMTKAIKEAQLREAQANLDYLNASRASTETQLQHYQGLIAAGKLSQEQAQIDLMTAASTVFLMIPVLKIAAAIVKALPDVKMGSPFTIGASLGGSTIGASLGFLAESGESIAEGLSMQGEALGMEAQFLRSKQDWILQRDLAIKELEQLKHQIEGANWQIQGAEHDLSVQAKETEHNQSIQTFMKEKFSNQELYQWMSGKMSALYFQTYKLAHDMAKAAERAFQFERGMPESQTQFISGTYWDSLRKGLLAGDSLGVDLDRMEQAYLDTNSRGFEITKTISLVELDPIAFLNLKSKGTCEFHFTEELFDYDFPGHYRRQVKTIALVLKAGEGKTVNATLTQLRNKMVMEPDVKAVKYLLNPQDSQPLTIRSDWRPSQQIAVSQIDSYTENSNGLFELRFDDDRYLPFEGTGAVSSWRLELNGKRGSYNINELADVKIELKYTARQGGKVFAEAVKGLLKPYETAVYFDLATMFPNEFFAFVNGETEDLEINVTRAMFPNLSGSKITGVYSLFEMKNGGEISVVMNDNSDLTLRSNKLLLTNALVVGARGETWRFTAKGQKLDLVNMGLVFAYKATVQ